MSFPLFDMIYAETDNMPNCTNTDKEHFCDAIKKMDEEGYELLYALIKCYAIKYDKDGGIPFAAKKCKNGYKFDISAIPDRLFNVLNHFVAKHKAKLREETHRNN
jgi:hypothetical protein